MGMPSWAKWGLSLAVAILLIWIGWRYSFVLVTLHVMVCIVLIIVIMLQSGSAADLAGAFDRIAQDHILAMLGTFPARGMVAQWLKAGVVEQGRLHRTEDGVPQGSK